MIENIQTIADRRSDAARLRSTYRRLAASRLPVNLYSAQAQMQRTAAALLHGMGAESGSWEELDGRQLADDVRGDRTSLSLAGATGGVAPTSALDARGSSGRGLLAAAGTGTLYLTHIEKIAPMAQHVLRSIIEAGRYTPVGDPFPRPINCRIIVATTEPLAMLAHRLMVEWNLACALGRVALRAEKVIGALSAEEIVRTHPSTFAAAS